MKPLRILFVTSEAAPLIKTGGLADVSGALPAALRRSGVDVRLLLPGYPQVLAALRHVSAERPSAGAAPWPSPPASGPSGNVSGAALRHVSAERPLAGAALRHATAKVAAEFSGLPGFPQARLLAGELPGGVPLWVIECAELYQRGGGPYQDEAGRDWPDNAQRFGLLSKIAAILGSAASPLAWRPDVVHCNDWQAGLTPAYLHYAAAAPSLMTVHNLAFQGIFPPQTAAELGLPAACLQPDGAEFYGSLSFLKAGLYYADRLSTVSPAYAQEIQTEELGFGLQGLLSQRRAVLTGILNGIDTEEWNPATDPHLAKRYDAQHLSAKAANKRALQSRMGLAVDAELPLFGMVGRFTQQKGLDVVLEAAPQLIELPAQLVLLGSGDARMQQAALALTHRYHGRISAYVGFDEALSHLIEAGADLFLMPSRFEPCGLNQMYSQRYGTPPLVHAVGGLADSVVDCNATTLADGSASGFMFGTLDAASLLATAARAAAAYRDKKTWRALQKNAMAQDFGWEHSAAAYRTLYQQLRRC